MRLFTLVCAAALGLAAIGPRLAHANCLQDVSRLISRDTERLLSQYHRITRRIQREGPSPRLRAEECRLARLLEPQLAGQIEALKQSRCRRDPSAATMVSDIVRGHESDLAVMREVKARPECR
ncbi:MAG TPA: hypothetical protein VNK48_14220 [Xanthobacteraceae bacterium]|nr:hypothetical protein [Xanthobacteraceae bacterium]